MATKYTFKFTDALNKTPFDVQSYTSNGIKVPSDPALLDRAAQANTTLKIYGKGLPDYGEGVFQDMVYMLENYAAATIPRYSIEGQLWYNNVGTGTGSPTTGQELFIRKTTAVGATEGLDVAADWTAVILASGSSEMTGELALAGTPTDPRHAVPLSYVTTHEGNFDLHLTAKQNDFLDNLDIDGSPPALTSGDVNQLIGIAGNVQTLLDNKLSLDGGTMNAASPAANITFVGGEVLGLPDVPSVNDAAASKKYVDDQNLAGTGELVAVSWLTPPPGSPPGSPPADVINIDETTARYTVTGPSGTTNLELAGIPRVGHGHEAIDVSLDNTFNENYPTDTQNAIEFINTQIEILETIVGPQDDVTIVLNIDRKLEILVSDILVGSPISPYEVLVHNTDDNNLSISINGIKQYTHTHASQNIIYDESIVSISSGIFTYIDGTLSYDFNVSVDGAPNVLVTVPSGTDISTHGTLISAINNIMNTASPVLLGDLTFQFTDSGTETFYSDSSGTGSTISITDPVTANPYLFAIDSAPDTISTATFLSDPIQITGSPLGSPVSIPDSIEILGDVTADFSVGQIFTIKGSSDATYGSYDGIYSVHVNGATAGGSPLTTSIPIAIPLVEDTNQPLYPEYQPTGSPSPVAPAPSSYGSVYISPIAGILSVETAVAGIEGDYVETDASGLSTSVGESSSYIVFNYDILTGSKIETIKYT